MQAAIDQELASREEMLTSRPNDIMALNNRGLCFVIGTTRSAMWQMLPRL
jgi:hypothetical protein